MREKNSLKVLLVSARQLISHGGQKAVVLVVWKCACPTQMCVLVCTAVRFSWSVRPCLSSVSHTRRVVHVSIKLHR